jgi:hypothetical protein
MASLLLKGGELDQSHPALEGAEARGRVVNSRQQGLIHGRIMVKSQCC